MIYRIKELNKTIKKKRNKILVLGSTGMLGSMVFDYFSKNKSFEIHGTYFNEKKNKPSNEESNFSKFDANIALEKQFLEIFKTFQPDYIINCIGIIKPYCKDENPIGVYNAIAVNSYFPYQLTYICENLVTSTKIIQIATDCVFRGTIGNYDENALHDPIDVYGKTKSLGEVRHKNFLNIRCSIIGPEINGSLSLLEWFLSHPSGSELDGFAHHYWNGITTLQFAQFCEEIILENKFDNIRTSYHIINYIKNKSVNKYELVNIFKEIFNRNYIIKKTSNIGEPIDRTLSSVLYPLKIQSMKTAIQNLKEYIDESTIYKY